MIGALFFYICRNSEWKLSILTATAKQMIAKDVAEDNQKNRQKSAMDKEHDGHADCDPKEDEANHSFHGRLLSG